MGLVKVSRKDLFNLPTGFFTRPQAAVISRLSHCIWLQLKADTVTMAPNKSFWGQIMLSDVFFTYLSDACSIWQVGMNMLIGMTGGIAHL